MSLAFVSGLTRKLSVLPFDTKSLARESADRNGTRVISFRASSTAVSTGQSTTEKQVTGRLP